MNQKRVNRVYVLGCNFRSGWNFDMGSSSTESWDDSLSWCVRSKSTYLHSKWVKSGRKHKLSKISWVINGPWSQWWRHQMGFVTDPMSSLISSFVKIGWEIAELLRSQAKNARKHKLSKISSVINEPWSQWWRHHDVIKWGLSLTPCHHSYQVWWRSDEKRSSYHANKPKMGRFCRKSVSRDPCDDVIMTSLNRLRPYSHINNPTKFDEDRMWNTRVIVFTDTQILQWQYLSLPMGKNITRSTRVGWSK